MDIVKDCIACSKIGKVVQIPISDFNAHNKIHEGFSYQCRYCPNLFFTEEEAKQHEKSDHEKIQCTECHKDMLEHFLLPDEFREHYSELHDKCKKECPECFNKFILESQKEQHFEKMHYLAFIRRPRPRRIRTFRCVHCEEPEQVFPNRDALKSHNKLKHPDKKVPCQACGNVFTQPHLRDSHYATNCEWR